MATRRITPLPDLRLSDVRALVRAHRHTTADLPGTRRAAVAAVLGTHRGVDVVLMIKRAAGGRNPGQYALPGGRVEPGESQVEAALRETHEEIGLPPDALEVLGRLDDFVADSGFVITPVVAAVSRACVIRRAPTEVAAVLPIALDRLIEPDLPRWLPRPGQPALFQLPLRRGLVVHAPTGALLWHLREVALLGRPHRLGSVTQPLWTRD